MFGNGMYQLSPERKQAFDDNVKTLRSSTCNPCGVTEFMDKTQSELKSIWFQKCRFTWTYSWNLKSNPPGKKQNKRTWTSSWNPCRTQLDKIRCSFISQVPRSLWILLDLRHCCLSVKLADQKKQDQKHSRRGWAVFPTMWQAKLRMFWGLHGHSLSIGPEIRRSRIKILPVQLLKSIHRNNLLQTHGLIQVSQQ